MQRARARWSTDNVASAAIAILGATVAVTGTAFSLSVLGILMVVGGAAWITYISLFSALVQTLAPDWVRARVVAIFLLAFQGGIAGGSVVWGGVGERAGVQTALLTAGISCIAIASISVFFRLPDAAADVSPWDHWRMPEIVKDVAIDLDDGPVLVTVEYVVESHQASAFVHAVREYGRVRRRDGASRWGLYHDTEVLERYVETFVVASWAEHLRQHTRLTQADRGIEERVLTLVRGNPKVHHLIDARRTIT